MPLRLVGTVLCTVSDLGDQAAAAGPEVHRMTCQGPVGINSTEFIPSLLPGAKHEKLGIYSLVVL